MRRPKGGLCCFYSSLPDRRVGEVDASSLIGVAGVVLMSAPCSEPLSSVLRPVTWVIGCIEQRDIPKVDGIAGVQGCL